MTAGEGGPPPAGSPGPRWGGDGASTRAPGAEVPARADEHEAPVVVRGNEPVPSRRRRDRVPPPPGFTAYAPFWRRALAWGIDEFVKTGIYLVIMLVLYTLTGGLPAPATSEVDFQAIAPRLVLSAGYDWFFWSQGWTPGASLMGMRIVRPDGAPPGGRSAAIRVGASLLSAMALFIGYLWMLWSPRRQTWHDIMGRTLVVMAVDADEEKRG